MHRQRREREPGSTRDGLNSSRLSPPQLANESEVCERARTSERSATKALQMQRRVLLCYIVSLMEAPSIALAVTVNYTATARLTACEQIELELHLKAEL